MTILGQRAYSETSAGKPVKSRVLVAVCALAAFQTTAQSQGQEQNYRSVAESAAQAIKHYDHSVNDVSTLIGSGEGQQTNCGKTTNERYEAFYCGKHGKVIVFSEAALENIGSTHGRNAIRAVVAHEFGHARQHIISGFTSDKIWTSSVDELQADCIAGVYMKNAVIPSMSESELDRTSSFMKQIGSYIFTERDWHGTPEMRSASFRHGYRSGAMDKCMASERGNWEKMGERVDQELNRAPERIESLIKWGSDIFK